MHVEDFYNPTKKYSKVIKGQSEIDSKRSYFKHIV